MAKLPKKRKPIDLEIAKRFKRGESVGDIAYSLDSPYGRWWSRRTVEAAIRRVMRRLEKEGK